MMSVLLLALAAVLLVGREQTLERLGFPARPDLAHVWCFWGWRGCWLGVLVGVVCTNRGCFSLLG